MGTVESNRKWRARNPEKVKAQKQREYKKHSIEIKARVKRWRKKNPEKARKARQRYEKKRRQIDNPHREEDDRKARARMAKWRINHPDGWNQWEARNKGHRRSWSSQHTIKCRLAKFGMTMADMDKLIVAQGGGCAICFQPERHRTRKLLSLDHDHRVNRARGFLCHKCNVGLGLFADDPERLRAAALYLEKYAARDAA